MTEIGALPLLVAMGTAKCPLYKTALEFPENERVKERKKRKGRKRKNGRFD